MLQRVLHHLDAHRDQAVGRVRELLAIPSVSTDPAVAGEVRRAAQWVKQALEAAGLQAGLHETPGHPIVLARSPLGAAPDEAPTVLFYGHYDVQPPDPLEGWTTPPFEPTVRDGALYARGASDDKGQVCCFLEALQAWREAAGRLPVHVIVLIEGEEEVGSAHLAPFMEAHREELSADVVLISDTTMWDAQTPAIIYGLRGLLYYDVQLHGPSRDLHSGMYGGTIANPATLLAQVLGRLFDDQQRVTLPGFYDDVQPLTAEERRRWDTLDFDETAYLASLGLPEGFGEAGYTTLERRWARPACDINGLYGGFGGPGAKTIIPSFAGAKVSFRLAANQDPRRIAAGFESWLRAQPVHGCRWKLTPHGMADPVAVATDSPFMRAAAGAIARTAGREPVLVREGATIPVVSDFKKRLGLDSLLIGFGLPEDHIHSPNESLGLDRFHLGCRTLAAVLDAMGPVG